MRIICSVLRARVVLCCVITRAARVAAVHAGCADNVGPAHEAVVSDGYVVEEGGADAQGHQEAGF